MTPKNEPEVENILQTKTESIIAKLRAAGAVTDESLPREFRDELQKLSSEERVVTAVASAIFSLSRGEHNLSTEDLTNEVIGLIELLITQGGVLALEEVAKASEKSLADVISKRGKPPTELDNARINFYALAKSLEIGHEVLQKRRNLLRFKQFEQYANRTLSKMEKPR